MRETIRIAALGLLAGSLLVMLYHAPVPVVRELQFIAVVMLATVATRSLAGLTGLSTLALGVGAVVFLVIGAGALFTAAGLDTTSGFTNWGLVPFAEEALKLAPVALVMMVQRRRNRRSINPSDLLMLGCCAGAGFALVENVALVQGSASVARDMARQYGPNLAGFYLVPGAWGSAGYVGHAAATGFIAGGYGLGRALQGRLGARWWIVPAACTAWILIEHAFVNLYVNAGSSFALILGNGRLTPWLFVALALAIVALDVLRYRWTLARSGMLRWRVSLARAAMLRTKPPVPRSRVTAARMYLSQVRVVNATGWFAHDHPPQKKVETV